MGCRLNDKSFNPGFYAFRHKFPKDEGVN